MPFSVVVTNTSLKGERLMEGYLGEMSVDIETHPKYRDFGRSDWVMLYIERYSGIDGDHHQKWLVDQIARILLGTPVVLVTAKWSNGYTEDRFRTGEPSNQYIGWIQSRDEYDEGIAP